MTSINPIGMALERMEGPIEYSAETLAPYNPAEAYPEFPALAVSAGGNPVFPLIRTVLHKLQLDAAHYGTTEWNPFGDFVQPGAKIVVKPNWVLHHNEGNGGMECLITHPSILRAVLEYVFLACPAQVVLGDAPLQGCDFKQILSYAGLDKVVQSFQDRGLPLIVKDFRRTTMTEAGLLKTAVSENIQPESEYVLVDLERNSFLESISKDWKRFRVTVYDPRKLQAHHQPGKHQYLIAKDVLEADLIINVPKLKTHKKTGITCCLKNLVGINGNKEYLPHHRKGGADGRLGRGDNYAHAHWKLAVAETLLDLANAHCRAFPRTYRLMERIAWRLMVKHQKQDPTAQLEGSWHGNDTVWRMCLDLNRILRYADVKGCLHESPQRKEISIVDAVIAGQGEGPLAPEPLAMGVVYAATNAWAGDQLAAGLLGFSAHKIPLLSHIHEVGKWPLADIPLNAAKEQIETQLASAGPLPPAMAPCGWRGYIEKEAP